MALGTFDEVQGNLSFLNTGASQIPGLVVMTMDAHGSDYGRYQHVLVVFNATTKQQSFSATELTGLKLGLHPVQQRSSDPIVRTAAFDESTGTAVVPALTTAVFVSVNE